MKLFSLFLILSTSHGFAQSTNYKNIVRQIQQGTGVVWDMQDVATKGTATSALLLETGGSLFQLWTIDQTTAKDYLLDQKLVGAYLPKADVKIISLDPYSETCTRIDQPFTVEIQVSDLLTGTGIPAAASKVLLEQHIESFPKGQNALDPTVVATNTPLSSAFITENGKTVIQFAASSLTATDPLKASGEEHFIVHALADGAVTQTQIAAAKLKVWPIATGAISGIASGEQYRGTIPTVQLSLNELYPRSDTFFMLYEGTVDSGGPGKLVKSYPWDSNVPQSIIITSDELTGLITKDGTYTVALMSKTVFDTRLLCETVTFSVKRTIAVNAMQTYFSDDATP
jgi:uncharacterized membrane protein